MGTQQTNNNPPRSQRDKKTRGEIQARLLILKPEALGEKSTCLGLPTQVPGMCGRIELRRGLGERGRGCGCGASAANLS
jgi:hypothetical protein